jgi:CubicO group peptidase (beta-lactamase class C family)
VPAFTAARSILEEARASHAFPAATCEIGRANGPLWTEAFGALTYDAAAPATRLSTPFDLASLTKVIATTSIVMSLVRSTRLRLDARVSDTFADWRNTDRETITVGQLLDHSSGLPAHVRLPSAAALPFLMTIPLERPIGSSSVYSDVGFMILGLLLETLTGQPLDVQWKALWDSNLVFNPRADDRPSIAPTEFDATRGGLIQGTVHDENAAMMGGVAAQAGLFGTASAVGAFAQWVLRSFREPTWLATPELMRMFASRRPVPGSSRALGWDTMLPTSSCGTRMSQTAIGHTGFTGTSLWIDWERDLYFVLLTNRVHPSRTNERFLPYRAKFHDAAADDLERG